MIPDPRNKILQTMWLPTPTTTIYRQIRSNMDLEINSLSKASQEEGYHMVSPMWNPKYTNQHIYETKPDSERTDLWLPREERRGRGGKG